MYKLHLEKKKSITQCHNSQHFSGEEVVSSESFSMEDNEIMSDRPEGKAVTYPLCALYLKIPLMLLSACLMFS